MLKAVQTLCTDTTQYDFVRLYGIERLRKTGKVPEATLTSYLNQLLQETKDNKIRTDVERLKQQIANDSYTQ